jgi:hypothetical protein
MRRSEIVAEATRSKNAPEEDIELQITSGKEWETLDVENIEVLSTPQPPVQRLRPTKLCSCLLQDNPKKEKHKGGKHLDEDTNEEDTSTFSDSEDEPQNYKPAPVPEVPALFLLRPSRLLFTST